jgi:MoaA/NifB/PqqE/SkfB family radical SAM enzyme
VNRLSPPGVVPRRATRAPGPLVRAAAWAVAHLYLRRPELAEVVAIRYRTLRALVVGLLNELSYRLGLSRAAGLLSLNLELTNHCNLKCTFCPTGNGSLRRPRGFLSEELFRRSVRGAGPLDFALLFQWGESLLHPAFDRLARWLSRRGVRTLITTNGTLLDEARSERLLAAGIERVTISVDGDERTHAAVRGVPLSRTLAGLERLLGLRARRGVRMAVDVSMVVSPETEGAALAFEERFRGRVDRVQRIPLLTHGERRTRCREPWRGGLVVLQDGRVTACCVDHEGELALGDARRESLRDIWNGPALRDLRRRHVRGDLPEVCARCTEYPTDAAAPRFSTRAEASARAPHLEAPVGARGPRAARRVPRTEPA